MTVVLRSLRFLIVVFASAGAIFACASPQAVNPSPYPSAPTQTFTPTIILTNTPTATPTPVLPVLEGTPVPQTVEKISVNSTGGLTQLARWGRGSFINAIYSPDGNNVAVSTTIGIYILDAKTLEEQYFLATSGAAGHAQYFPDGKRIAIAYRDVVEIISSSDGYSLAKFIHPANDISDGAFQDVAVIAMALSANGEFAAAAYSDSTFALWRVSNGELVSDLTVLEEKVGRELKSKERLSMFRDVLIGLALSPDGKALYVGLSMLKIIEFDVVENRVLRVFPTRYSVGEFVKMALSADGSVLMASGYTYQSSFTILWNTESGLLRREIKEGALAISPDGQFISAVVLRPPSNNYSIEIWETKGNTPPNVITEISETELLHPIRLRFSPEGAYILLFDLKNIRLLNVVDGKLVRLTQVNFPDIYYASLSPKGDRVAVIDAYAHSKGMRIINIEDGSSFYALKNIKSIQRAKYTPDGESLFVASWDTLYLFSPNVVDPLYNSTNGEDDVWVNLGRYERPLDITVSKNFGFIAIRSGAFVGYEDILAYSLYDQEYFYMDLLPFADPFSSDWTTLEFSPDENYLAVGAGKLQLIRTKDWEKVGEVAATHGTFSRSGAHLAYGQTDRSIRISTVPELAPVLTTAQLPDITMSLAYSPSGTILATGSNDGTLRLWNAADGTLLKEIEAHNGMIVSMEFLPDGKSLLTFGLDSTIRLWGIMP